ncbi:MAG TPA: hypothetical protein VF525_11550 [Pyrinomonadaceae bacterium]|jgi:hypothetical protein
MSSDQARTNHPPQAPSPATSSDATAAPQPHAPALPTPLVALLARLAPHPRCEMMQHIFSDLTRMLGYLNLVESKVRQERLLVATMSVFLRLHAEARSLVSYIEGDAWRQARSDELLAGALEGVGYAIAHELRRVFEIELVGLDELHNSSAVRARLEHAHGMLRNAMQQSLIVLAQVFDPNITGEELFDDFALRRQQSLKLYRELDQLLQLARHVEMTGDLNAVSLLLARLILFRDESMCHLMYRDWDEYESFINELRAAQSQFELLTVLNSLTCYLETLLSQVRMRSSLADYNLDVNMPVGV